MYAILQNGGKQYRVIKGQTLRLEKLNIKIGNIVEFPEVLMIVDGEKIEIGVPFVKNSVIKAEIITHGRNDKLKIIKFRRRKHYRKQLGHRQWFTDLKITNIISNNN